MNSNTDHVLRASHRALALGSALLWGLVELVALWRSRWLGGSQR